MGQRIIVTGANSAVGLALWRAIARSRQPGIEWTAVVRSAGAARPLEGTLPEAVRIARADPSELGSLRPVLEGAEALIHLPGLLVEKPGSSYEHANIRTAQTAAQAARQVGLARIVLLSAVGADASARNGYFRSKGVAEEHVRASGLDHVILRVPLLLGPATEGSRALLRETRGGPIWLLGGGRTRHQPLDVDDLAEGVLRTLCGGDAGASGTIELAGSEAVSYREIVERGAALRGRAVQIRSLPVWLARTAVVARHRLTGSGFSPDALEVLLTDTPVIPSEGARRLGIEPAPLDAVLRNSLGLAGP